uniref:Nodulation protein NfeD n=1 Tax=Candidatus Methanomethylicus mesodigestus TaxID=1867258 RepID=A0A7C3J242_9CREN
MIKRKHEGTDIKSVLKKPLIFFFFFVLLVSLSNVPAVESSNGKILIFRLEGTITVAHAEAFADALVTANLEGCSAVVMTISTPGGSVDAMLRIISSIDNSAIPVIAYVFPTGSTAWSAGTYILMASHIAAMAPQTVIGSCQPVSYSPLGSTPIDDSKIINALVSVMETHANARNRNATLATLFITENLNVDDLGALQNGVIEVRANGIANLLSQLDGVTVNTAVGQVTLATAGAETLQYNFRLRESILNSLSDPMISSILFIVGIFALIYGFSAPGYGGEIIGGIAILLALIGMGFDVNVLSIVMLIAGAVMLVYELATPGFGILGISGIIVLTIGALFIVPFSPEKWSVTGEWYSAFTSIILAIAISIAAIAVFIIYKVLQVRRRKPVIGTMLGDFVIPTKNAAPNETIYVLYNGEQWSAKCEVGIKSGRKYRIVRKEGPVLILEDVEK